MKQALRYTRDALEIAASVALILTLATFGAVFAVLALAAVGVLL